MRGRIWIFAVLVAAALVLHLVLLSAKAAQSGEDNVRARLAQSTSALRAQLELLDARLVPRAVAAAPDLIEATRPPADPTQPLTRPDERALRAAASALSPAPDLLAVVNGQGAILSRRAKAAQGLDDATGLPLAKAALEGNPPPAFATFEGGVYRVAAARIPGNGAAAVVGTLVDDRLAAQLKSQVDADVTLLQGGKVLASSLPQGEDRARLLRWAVSPAPGYGVLQVWLPVIGNALSGKLPRGGTRYAVRAALVTLDSGVQAALTVPAGPYLGWLGRYQAFYALGLALFVLFSLLWGLLARPAAAPLLQSSEAAPAALPRLDRSVTSLLGTDAGEARAAPPPTADVPWPSVESTEVTPTATAKLPAAQAAAHPMWSADPFTPTPPAVEPQTISAEEAGLVEDKSEDASSAAKGDFSFAGLLDDKRSARASGEEAQPERADGPPPAEEPAPFPGDEPTRIEPVSAALLDKLRERDEEMSLAANPGWGSLVPEGDPVERTAKRAPTAVDHPQVPAGIRPEPDAAPAELEAATDANVTMHDFSMPALETEDPDATHWHETYDRFKELKVELGEPADKITFEKFAAKLQKNRADLLARHSCKGVRFSVYAKDGKAAIKATAIR